MLSLFKQTQINYNHKIINNICLFCQFLSNFNYCQAKPQKSSLPMSLSPPVLFCLNLQAITITSIKINLSGMLSEEMNPQFDFQDGQLLAEYKTAQDQMEEIIASLSSKERYIKVFSFAHTTTIKKQNRRPPKVVVYQETDDLTISDLVYKYAALTNQPNQGVNIDFALQGGFVLDKQKTIKQIKKILRVDCLDGIELYMESLSDTLYINECAMQSMIQAEVSFNKDVIQVPFALPGMNYSIYVPIAHKSVKNKNKETLKEVLAHLITEIQRVFAKKLDKQNIQLVFKMQEKQILNQHIEFGTLAKDSKVQVRFKDQTKLPAPPHQNNSFLVISGYGVTSKKLHYDDIKEKRLVDLLNQIQARANWGDFGIIINEFVIKPQEKLSKADAYMKNPNPVSKNFAGKIIPETLIFLAEQQRIRKANTFELEKVIDENSSNLELRTTCKSKIQDRAQSTSHLHFKGNLKNVEPILLYTSQLYVKPSNQTTSLALYRNLNTFLREQQFQNTMEKDYKQKWEYPFTSELLQQLKKIQPQQKQVLWRGVSYLPNHKIGDRILYKQFNSTSSDCKMVKRLFANDALFKITKSHSGKPIKDFSFFKSEKQFLFEPYIEFEVKNVSQIENEQKNKKKITLFEIQEIPRPPMPDSKALYLLWVDDKTKEGLMMWNSLTDIKDTSVMIPLLTTEQLKLWLKDHQALLKDETVQFVMVTNMTRMEKGVKKDEAGIEAITEYRKVKPNGHVFVYIGWVEGTLNKLKKHKLDPNNKLQVSNVEQNLRKFLNEVGGLK